MQIVSLILDGLILILLAATVFYAGRLSLALKAFREGKADFAKLLQQLNQATTQAEASIQKLQKSTEDSGHDLQLRLNQGKAISEELQLVTEAATNLADRLEDMASKNREIARRIEKASGIGGEALDLGGGLSASSRRAGRSPDAAGESSSGDELAAFAIRDREAAGGTETGLDEDVDDGEFQSAAEKELATALKKSKKGS